MSTPTPELAFNELREHGEVAALSGNRRHTAGPSGSLSVIDDFIAMMYVGSHTHGGLGVAPFQNPLAAQVCVCQPSRWHWILRIRLLRNGDLCAVRTASGRLG